MILYIDTVVIARTMTFKCRRVMCTTVDKSLQKLF